MRGIRSWRLEAGVFAVASAVRLLALFEAGGLHPDVGYDASVYYAAADALLHGRVPYGDFVLLHPPLVMLLLTPFAALGMATTDPVGYFAGHVAACVVGAVNAVLVVRILRRFGSPAPACAAGGLFYALFLGSVIAEHESRLEPFGNLFLLLALLAAARAVQRLRTWPLLLAGAAAAAAVTVKIWYCVPALAVVCFLAWRARRRWYLPVIGAACAGGLVVLPFAAAAPAQMWQMVVREQLARPSRAPSLHQRLGELFGPLALEPRLHYLPDLALTGAVVALLAVVAACALRTSPGRAMVALLALQLATFLEAPSWFSFYDDFPAVPLALTLGVAVTGLRGRTAARAAPRRRPLEWIPPAAATLSLAIAVATTVGVFAQGRFQNHPAVPPQHAEALVAGDRCVMADSPAGLIALDRLSSQLAAGCPNWVDFDGYGYRYWVTPGRHTRTEVTHLADAAEARYLTQTGAALVVLELGNRPLMRALAAHRVLGRGPGWVVFGGPRPARSPPVALAG